MNTKPKKKVIVIITRVICLLALILVNPIKYKLRFNKAKTIVEKSKIEKWFKRIVWQN